jgi:hypothetical protein
MPNEEQRWARETRVCSWLREYHWGHQACILCRPQLCGATADVGFCEAMILRTVVPYNGGRSTVVWVPPSDAEGDVPALFPCRHCDRVFSNTEECLAAIPNSLLSDKARSRLERRWRRGGRPMVTARPPRNSPAIPLKPQARPVWVHNLLQMTPDEQQAAMTSIATCCHSDALWQRGVLDVLRQCDPPQLQRWNAWDIRGTRCEAASLFSSRANYIS